MGHFSGMRAWLWLVVCFLPFLAMPCYASDDYTISGVPIDIPVTDATTARDVALEAALGKAYEELKTKRAAAGETLPASSGAALWRLMQDFEVAGEKISATRYVGSFTIRFKPHAVAQMPAEVPVEDSIVGVAAGGYAVQPASFVFSNLMEWQAARSALKNIVGLRHFAVSSFRRNQVDVDLSYVGEKDALTNALIAGGFYVAAMPGDAERWQLSFRR